MCTLIFDNDCSIVGFDDEGNVDDGGPNVGGELATLALASANFLIA